MMDCPNCGIPEKVYKITCVHCGDAQTSKDLLEMRKLEFLVEETESWEAKNKERQPYIKRLNALVERMLPQKQVEPKPEPVVALATVTPVVATTPKPKPTAPVKLKAPKEKVPFDQWLLSERNIKFALYSGAGLLVLAGVIFVGINWDRIPGLGKFGITLMTSAAMYYGGMLLSKRPGFKLGGDALLAIAGGFFALNFVVLQNYVLGPAGLSPDIMWLAASPLCLALYAYTAYWTESELFTYLSLVALGSMVTAGLNLVNAGTNTYFLSFVVVLFGLLLLSKQFNTTKYEGYTVKQLFWVSQILMPLGFVFSFAGWINSTECQSCGSGNAWVALIAIAVVVIFYVVTDIVFGKKIVRWVVAPMSILLAGMMMNEIGLSRTATGLTFIGISLVYLGVGYVIEMRNEDNWVRGTPFFVLGYIVALMVTMNAVGNQADFSKLLYADAAILGVSAYIHKNYKWVYGAVWVFMLPFWLSLDLSGLDVVGMGAWMGALGVGYFVVGYLLGRKDLRFSGPFLSAAVFLSAVTTLMTWQDVRMVSMALGVTAALYAFSARWLDKRELLLASLGSISLAVIPITLRYSNDNVIESGLSTFFVLGALMLIAGMVLRQTKSKDWGWPLYIFGAFDLGGAYLLSIGLLGGWYVVSFSAVAAALSFSVAWLEKEEFEEGQAVALLSYLGVGAIIIGHFFLLAEVLGSQMGDVWPVYTLGLTALFVAAAYVMRNSKLAGVYEKALRQGGLLLVFIPLMWVFVRAEPLLGTVAFVIAGITYLADAGLRKKELQTYIGIGMMTAAHFYLLIETLGANVNDWPLYTALFSALLVGTAWMWRKTALAATFETPFRRVGMLLMVVPMLATAMINQPVLMAITYGIAASTYALDAWARKLIYLTYLSVGIYILMLWSELRGFGVSEQQAFAMPLGFALLAMGWYERYRRDGYYYQVFTVGGLVALMGSAYLQSLPDDGIWYAVLLAVESLVALWWGIRMTSRSYVQFGGIALLVNALVQYGPAFADMDRWLQIGSIGTILLGLGMLALGKREQLLETRSKLTEEWRGWES